MKKIVIRVQMNCDKSRRKAMKIAAAAQGVSSVSLEGEDKDHVVVMGDGVDPVCLTDLLRKKFRHATLETVEVITDDGGDEPGDSQYPPPCPTYDYPPPSPKYYYPPPSPTYYPHVVHDPYPSNCSIQ